MFVVQSRVKGQVHVRILCLFDRFLSSVVFFVCFFFDFAKFRLISSCVTSSFIFLFLGFLVCFDCFEGQKCLCRGGCTGGFFCPFFLFMTDLYSERLNTQTNRLISHLSRRRATVEGQVHSEIPLPRVCLSRRRDDAAKHSLSHREQGSQLGGVFCCFLFLLFFYSSAFRVGGTEGSCDQHLDVWSHLPCFP